jgi:hypothetical protein
MFHIFSTKETESLMLALTAIFSLKETLIWILGKHIKWTELIQTRVQWQAFVVMTLNLEGKK